VPVSRIAEFIEHTDGRLKATFEQTRIYCFGHVGDGNLHYNIGPPPLLEKRDAVNAVVYDAVARFGGSISAEHGIGQLKREAIRSRKPALELELMRAVKAALDPKDLMNPGKVL
jgi:FAD/FMN-containing dehydrogenase